MMLVVDIDRWLLLSKLSIFFNYNDGGGGCGAA